MIYMQLQFAHISKTTITHCIHPPIKLITGYMYNRNVETGAKRNPNTCRVVQYLSKVEFKFSIRGQQQIIDIEVGINQVQILLQRIILQFKTPHFFKQFSHNKKKKGKKKEKNPTLKVSYWKNMNSNNCLGLIIRYADLLKTIYTNNDFIRLNRFRILFFGIMKMSGHF